MAFWKPMTDLEIRHQLNAAQNKAQDSQPPLQGISKKAAGKRRQDDDPLKDGFRAQYINPKGDIATPEGIAEYERYAAAKKDPKTARFLNDQERCGAGNRRAVAMADDEGVIVRDFAHGGVVVNKDPPPKADKKRYDPAKESSSKSPFSSLGGGSRFSGNYKPRK